MCFHESRRRTAPRKGEAPGRVGDGVQQLLADGLTVQDDLHAFQDLGITRNRTKP